MTRHDVRYYEEVGERALPFLQGMMDRLGVGSARYGQRARRQGPGYDYASSALLRTRAAVQTRNLEFLVDAANMLLLAWEKGEGFDGEADPADSPGAVGLDGRIVNARGRYAMTNGDRFEDGGTRLPDSLVLLEEVARRLRSAREMVQR